MYATICVTVLGVAVVGLCGYVIYLWQGSAKKETGRLYAWLDDILDRIGSENIERYALCRRVKYEMNVKSTDEKVADDIDKTNAPKKFVHSR